MSSTFLQDDMSMKLTHIIVFCHLVTTPTQVFAKRNQLINRK